MKQNRQHKNFRRAKWRGLLAALFSAGGVLKLFANPDGMTVVTGSATAQTVGATLNLTVGQNTFLDWQHFNIAPGETTRFIQPGVDSIVFNRINDANPSQIWGNLSANGTVVLANAHGFYFGPNSMIQVGLGFIATTAPIAPDLGAGGAWQFTGLPPTASIINYGTIETGNGGNLFLIAERIENHGTLNAPGGSLALAAGQEVLLSERPDGRGLSTTVRVPTGGVDNFGRITADAGTIALHAQVVNQNGRVQADSVREHNGVVELYASDEINLGANSVITANGGEGTGAGGNVTIKSGGTFSDVEGSRIEARGGAAGGDGGHVEISAPVVADIRSQVDGSAQAGFTGGSLLIDPVDLTLNNNSLNPFVGFSSIAFQATHDITFAANTLWNLSSAIGLTTGQLTVQAGNNITFGNGARITDANNWSVALQAGYDFGNNTVQSGVGSIFLNGGSGLTQSGAIETSRGDLNLTAGDSIIVGTGYIRTVGGGNISAHALSGDVNAGRANGGYSYSINGYTVNQAGLGQIATAAGGNVWLEAGRDVISIPTVPANTASGASGAYGSQPGDVTVIAGRSILGNYLVRNGTGTLLSGVKLAGGVPQILNPSATIGSLIQPVSLSLISGSWNAWAGGDVFINEVRNPNGTFNANRLLVDAAAFLGNVGTDSEGNFAVIAPPVRSSFLFDYAANAAANFWAGNSITLVGANLPRVNGQNTAMPAIYAPQLSLNAGAGGINILNSLILAPSAQGSLHITTRDGGNLNGRQLATSLTGITMSDSALPGWATFANEHAYVPLHLFDANPVTMDISGGINNFGLTVPKFARVNVAGNTFNFGFRGQNNASSGNAALTEINVAGDITYRGNLTSVPVTEAPLTALLDPAISPNPAALLKLRYDAVTGTLTFIGQMTSADLEFLLNPVTFVYDQYGLQVFDVNEQPVTQLVTVSAAVKTALNQLYADSQSASLGDQGLAVAGPGIFRVNAQNASLGISGGINVLAPNRALENISPRGANLEVNIAHNLDMTSTKVANESYLGGITLNVGGTLDVGGQLTTLGDSGAPQGIFTTSGGDVNVFAHDNVNVNGSRIAAYNGGNITVRSGFGNVNAGLGGSGYVSLRALELDPLTGRLIGIPASIPGSGIVATTLVGGRATVGNILVETPRGDIIAGLGGVVQLAFNGSDTSRATTELLAGYELRDADGNLVLAKNLAGGILTYVSPDRNIDASGSGVIAQNLIIRATGKVKGLFVSTGTTTIDTTKGFDGPTIVISQDPPKINAPTGGDGGGSDPIVVAEGQASSEAVAAPVAKTERNSDESDKKEANKTAESELAENSDEEGFGKGKGKGKGNPPGLTRKVSRVTVVLNK